MKNLNTESQCEVIFSKLFFKKIVQLPREKIHQELLSKIAEISSQNGYTIYSNLSVGYATKISGEIFRELLGNELINAIEAPLQQYFSMPAFSHYAGGGISQSQWMYLDDYYGGILYDKDCMKRLWEKKVLLILDLPGLVPNATEGRFSSNDYLPPSDVQYYIEIAELLSAVSHIHHDTPVRVLIRSDQEQLFNRLSEYLLRQSSDAFSATLLFFKDDGDEELKLEPVSKYGKKSGQRNQVFISYAKEDYETAERLCKSLREEGVAPWLDSESLLPGQKWSLEISRAIRECSHFIALLSTNSVSKKGYVQKELKMAIEKLDEYPQSEIFIIPVRLNDCEIKDEKLRELHWIDMFKSYENGVKKLLQVIK